MAKPALKRHEVLQPLSREHMNGLIQARNLQRAADGSAQDRRRAVHAFVQAWHDEIAHHFDDEERILLPLIEDAGERDRLLEEHRVLREMAHRCEAETDEMIDDSPAIRRLGVLLHDHIRWEERVLFELVQRDHPKALDAMLDEAARIEKERPQSQARKRLDDWPAPPIDPSD